MEYVKVFWKVKVIMKLKNNEIGKRGYQMLNGPFLALIYVWFKIKAFGSINSFKFQLN